MARGKGLHLATIGHVRALLSGADDLIALAKRQAPDPAVFDDGDPFVWQAEISSSRLDAYKTRMHESTLRNFADGATKGVSFLHSHLPWEFIGKSLRGTYRETGETDEQEIAVNTVEGAFFTIPGRKFGSMGTDDFIAGVRAGILFDVSVGFYADDIRCGICGGEMFAGWFGIYGRECSHVPGLAYDVLDANGNPVIGPDGEPLQREAFAWVYDGELSEVSGVHDGATPEADVSGVGPLKARLMAEAGKLDRHQVDRLDQIFRTRLPRPRDAWAGGVPLVVAQRQPRTGEIEAGLSPAEREGADMNGQQDAHEEAPQQRTGEEQPVAPRPRESTVTLDGANGAATARATGGEGDALAEEATRWAVHGIEIGTDPVLAVRSLCETIVRLQPDADLGRQYREDVIGDALDAGVRAKGADVFKREQYEGILRALPLDAIKTMRDDWTAEGDRRLAGTEGAMRGLIGGRLTVDGDERTQPAGEGTTGRRQRPESDRAYAG